MNIGLDIYGIKINMHYSTSDLYLTAYLKIKGHKFKVEKTSKKSTKLYNTLQTLHNFT